MSSQHVHAAVRIVLARSYPRWESWVQDTAVAYARAVTTGAIAPVADVGDWPAAYQATGRSIDEQLSTYAEQDEEDGIGLVHALASGVVQDEDTEQIVNPLGVDLQPWILTAADLEGTGLALADIAGAFHGDVVAAARCLLKVDAEHRERCASAPGTTLRPGEHLICLDDSPAFPARLLEPQVVAGTVDGHHYVQPTPLLRRSVVAWLAEYHAARSEHEPSDTALHLHGRVLTIRHHDGAIEHVHPERDGRYRLDMWMWTQLGAADTERLQQTAPHALALLASLRTPENTSAEQHNVMTTYFQTSCVDLRTDDADLRTDDADHVDG